MAPEPVIRSVDTSEKSWRSGPAETPTTSTRPYILTFFHLRKNTNELRSGETKTPGSNSRPLSIQNSGTHLMTWFESIRSRVARVAEQPFLSKPLRQFRGRAENVALRIREFFLRHTSNREASVDVTN